jgi:uncharacterized membrane protein YphA (DoxX/SURF4 family)
VRGFFTWTTSLFLVVTEFVVGMAVSIFNYSSVGNSLHLSRMGVFFQVCATPNNKTWNIETQAKDTVF